MNKIYSNNSDEKVLLEDALALQIMDQFKIQYPKSRIVKYGENLEYAIRELAFPLVIKAKSVDLAHKADVKAVFVNQKDYTQLHSSYYEIMNSLIEVKGLGKYEILIQEMVQNAKEMFVGIKKDPSFGYALVMGSGGIYTELFRDFVCGILPMDSEQIKELISQTQFSKIIEGFRGQPALPKEKIVETILKIQDMIMTYDEIKEIDINPLMITDAEVYVADMKVYI